VPKSFHNSNPRKEPAETSGDVHFATAKPATWPPALRVPRAAPLFRASAGLRTRAASEPAVPAGYKRDPRFAELDAAILAEDQRARRARRAASACP
jgi:hypothetical protein